MKLKDMFTSEFIQKLRKISNKNLDELKAGTRIEISDLKK